MSGRNANFESEKEVDFKVSVSEYQELIIEMVRGINRTNSIKMLYGFTKRLYKEEKTGN